MSFYSFAPRSGLALSALLCAGQLTAAQPPADDSEIKELRSQVETLNRRLAKLETRGGPSYLNLGFVTAVDAGWSTEKEPSERLELGDHDPQQRGFSLRNAELAIDGAVDPYFKGFGNIVLKLDEENETDIELEEAYLLSTSLPNNLQLKAGAFYAEFGRHNTQHPHQWAFVDQPLILNRVFGGEGLRNVGARASWLAPTPFYTELMLGVFNGSGETAYSFRNEEADFYGHDAVERGLDDPGDLLYVPRIASSCELNNEQTLLVGASAALGPNSSGDDKKTQIYGVDAYWKWKPADAEAGFPFVSWQTEALYRRFEAGAGMTNDDPPVETPAETLKDWGIYSQVLWGFQRRWIAGLRGEYVNANRAEFEGDEESRGDRVRISPNLTFLPSEFSKLRLQYNYDDLESGGDEHSVWLRLEFALGAHAAHKF